jgi:hypothetical protein
MYRFVLPCAATKLREALLRCLIRSGSLAVTTAVAVVRFVLVVAVSVIDVDHNDNGPFSVCRGLELGACALGNAQVTFSRAVRRALVDASSFTYVGHTRETLSAFLSLTHTYAQI